MRVLKSLGFSVGACAVLILGSLYTLQILFLYVVVNYFQVVILAFAIMSTRNSVCNFLEKVVQL